MSNLYTSNIFIFIFGSLIRFEGHQRIKLQSTTPNMRTIYIHNHNYTVKMINRLKYNTLFIRKLIFKIFFQHLIHIKICEYEH